MSSVEEHYTQGNIYNSIVSILERSGIDTGNLTRKDIAVVDEFHIRGQEITRELAQQAALLPEMKVLDVGCGLGGACRLFAGEFGCNATGIDITAEYIDTATRLSKLTGMQQGTRFVQASALDLPFPHNSFDIVWTQHVQMNIGDKKQFYSQIARVLRPAGRFVYYDIFIAGKGPLHYPLPWASDASISHLVSTSELKNILQELGLIPLSTSDETAKSIASLQNMFGRAEKEGLPELGTHLMMGDNAMEKLENLLRNLLEKKIVVESGILEKGLTDQTDYTDFTD